MKNFMEKIDEKSAATFLVTILALINQVLNEMGHPIINISTDQVNTVVAVAFTIATSVGGFFMNRTLLKPDTTTTNGGDKSGQAQK
ncbi:phage holin [Lactiplantibacillus xiangfangensis]|uniref:phage holin n=1 Tax=Lactiplantibacillus xiangfangensis TaxID=942150 RepID=UPI00384F6AFE